MSWSFNNVIWSLRKPFIVVDFVAFLYFFSIFLEMLNILHCNACTEIQQQFLSSDDNMQMLKTA